MPTCQNQAAARHALPQAPMPVHDRRITLTIPCHEDATYDCALMGVGVGKARQGAVVQHFELCDNHTELFQQIDFELVQDGWTRSHSAPPVRKY
jgi:hypothetical protein